MHSRGDHWSPAKKIKVTLCLSYFCVTKRRVQGGEATSERRRRDGVYQKSSKRAFTPVSTTRFYCMIIAKTNPISLCSHPDPRQNINREVRHSPTWHSSKSESALERFEPVAVVQQLPDGRGSVFAPEGDGCLQDAKWEDAGRFSKEGKSLDDFWYTPSRRRRSEVATPP